MDQDLTPIDILLVEDNPQDIEITMRALRKKQVKNQVLVARDGQEALDILFPSNGNSSNIGLILLDLNLPKVSGREVLERIKQEPNTKSIPVVVLTTSTRDEDVARTYDLGVNTFITKPVVFETFMEVVATIRDYWIVVATLPKAKAA